MSDPISLARYSVVVDPADAAAMRDRINNLDTARLRQLILDLLVKIASLVTRTPGLH